MASEWILMTLFCFSQVLWTKFAFVVLGVAANHTSPPRIAVFPFPNEGEPLQQANDSRLSSTLRESRLQLINAWRTWNRVHKTPKWTLEILSVVYKKACGGGYETLRAQSGTRAKALPKPQTMLLQKRAQNGQQFSISVQETQKTAEECCIFSL